MASATNACPTNNELKRKLTNPTVSTIISLINQGVSLIEVNFTNPTNLSNYFNSANLHSIYYNEEVKSVTNLGTTDPYASNTMLIQCLSSSVLSISLNLTSNARYIGTVGGFISSSKISLFGVVIEHDY